MGLEKGSGVAAVEDPTPTKRILAMSLLLLL